MYLESLMSDIEISKQLQSMGPIHGGTSMMYELANYEHTVCLWNIILCHWFVFFTCLLF